jgi:hypothetical protein
MKAWWNRQIEGEHPYLYLDGIVMKRSWAGEVRNVSLRWLARECLQPSATTKVRDVSHMLKTVHAQEELGGWRSEGTVDH